MKFLAGAGILACLTPFVFGQSIHGRDGITIPTPPPVEAVPVTDNYSGTHVVDNYRWLEDGKSTQTRAFIDAENAYTNRYMKQVRIRSQAVDDLTDLENVSAAAPPLLRGENYFFRKRLAGEQRAQQHARRTGPAG